MDGRELEISRVAGDHWEGKAETHFIVPSVQRPEMDSAKEPVVAQRGQSSLAVRDRFSPLASGDPGARTLRIQHLLDGARDAGGVAADDELEAVA